MPVLQPSPYRSGNSINSLSLVTAHNSPSSEGDGGNRGPNDCDSSTNRLTKPEARVQIPHFIAHVVKPASPLQG